MSKRLVNKLKTKIWLHAILFYNLKCTLTFFIKRILSFFYQDLSNTCIYRNADCLNDEEKVQQMMKYRDTGRVYCQV